ncbi:HK97 family phage prohead protease [Microbacterium sp. cf332]|uniref:HK97 family phage prohead protease n=1 Tax=Microbacterium sp. cf332 TaxID=1761804 RepID=UPI0015A43C73|nr:HK97 family phage prohead protease [Microbacterium sp. cf332]
MTLGDLAALPDDDETKREAVDGIASALRGGLRTGQIETREATLEFRADESADEGVIEGYAVPYGEIADIGGRYRESFERGAFDGSQDIKLYRDHKTIIGHVLETEDRDGGLWVRAKVALSDLGRDTLALLRSGALNRFSVGFIPLNQRTSDAGVVVRTKALLREISVVERPAYSGASILSVREESTPINGETTMTDSVSPADVNELRGQVEDIERRFETFTTSAPSAPAVDRRSAGAVVKAMVSGDAETIDAYNRAQEHRHDELQQRDFNGAVMADAPVRAEYVQNLTRLYDNTSGVQARLFSRGTLPATGKTVEFVRLATNTLKVEEQVNEGDTLAYGKLTFEDDSAPIKTFGGWTELSRQAIERSSIPVLNTTLEALTIEAGKRKKIELRKAVTDVINARKAITANGGVVVLGSTLAASEAGRWEDALIDAAMRFDLLNAAPEALVVSASVFKKLRSLTVSGERVFTVANGNHTGSLNLPGLTGNLAGLPVYLDAGQTGDEAYFLNGRAIKQYDSALFSLSDENITNLTKQFSVYFYGAIADEFPELIVPVKLAAS